MSNITGNNIRRWLSPQQAAEYLGVHKSFLDKDRVTRLHGVPFTRLGRRILYDVRALDAFLERNQQGGEAA